VNENAPGVIKIPAKPELEWKTDSQRQLRVAAYCRVSTKEDQANSYEVQKEYYTDKIMSNPAWTMTGISANVTWANAAPWKARRVALCEPSGLRQEILPQLAFSPRNLRRMRYFYRMYGDTPELLAAAMRLNWTQNVVIMEAGLTMDERCWYIRKAAERGVSKTELLRMIERAEHSEIALGENEDTCYNVENDEFSEKNRYEEYPVYLPWKHLPQPHGGVRDEGLGEEGRACFTVPYRVGSHQPRGDRQPRLSSGAAQAVGAWDLQRRRLCHN